MKPEVNMVGRLTRNVTNTFKNEDGSSERALFTLACNSYYNGKDGNGAKVKKESVDYVPCVAWAGLVPILTTWGLKGRLLHIRGVLDTFQAGPDDATGKYPPTKVQVKVVELQFLDKKPEGVETPKSSAPAAVESEHNITKIAEKVASLLLGAANASPQANTAQQANNANAQAEEAANAQAEEAANAQAAAGGDLGSVI